MPSIMLEDQLFETGEIYMADGFCDLFDGSDEPDVDFATEAGKLIGRHIRRDYGDLYHENIDENPSRFATASGFSRSTPSRETTST